RSIAVEARPGRITAILGPNAAGKSTLLRCMIGALRAERGRVLIDGVPAHRLRATMLARRVAYVPQRPTVSAAFTVRQVVELGRYALAANAARVQEAIERLDLAGVADRPYPELSAGQQQRVALARVVAQLESDGHLLLDEPTSAMDLRHIALTMRLLRELASGGATVVVAMHDISLAAAISQDVWLLDGGRVVAAGEASSVLEIDRLRSVFGVDFQWLDDGHGAARLLADVPT
ncbi:MAG: ATP-binding cassette domain-containing protein, partial [Phycisphaerales bacterium]|nr:ATP-binding cassette domain-containing protein [Phycisphaerales bacterium]